MNERKVLDAIEDLALQLSNLWDSPDLEPLARGIEEAIYPKGRPCVEAFRLANQHNLHAVIDGIRDWCDMTESALFDVEDALGDDGELSEG